MTTRSLARWLEERAAHLDEIDRDCRAIKTEVGLGRSAIVHLNQLYTVRIVDQFFAFVRDLLTECADQVAAASRYPEVQRIVLFHLLCGRRTDAHQWTTAAIADDFARLQIDLFPAVVALGSSFPPRLLALEEMVAWREAILTQRFSEDMLRAGKPALRFAQVEVWRKSAEKIAEAMSEVVVSHLRRIFDSASYDPTAIAAPAKAATCLPGMAVRVRGFVGGRTARTLENRGPLGYRGRRIVSIELTCRATIDFPEDELEVVPG